MRDIWIFVQHREGEVGETTFGLAIEARRLLTQLGDTGRVSAVALGPVAESELGGLGGYGVDRVIHADGSHLNRYQGEIFARTLADLIKAEGPACLLMAQSAETEDLSQRVAALMGTALVTRAMDFTMESDGTAKAIRPVANGYLFEDILLRTDPPPIVTFLPSVLVDPEPDSKKKAKVERLSIDQPPQDLKTRTIEVIEAAPEDLDLEEADIIVAGGRGVGKDEAFDIVHDLARAIGGSVGATRPIIDWGTVPYERQIGQTGKYVAPRLIINCGISGANEYTAGMEKSQKVVAIDLNPRARMFRFADLGVVGDVHTILPLLISRIEEQK
jgi:electron transfer flavoprotein alpha subunit